ncbi:MAG TPA: hypothetical protein VH475_02990 [Tepidisphaeraceae bacterium]|jgi:hypothetical protein
MVATDFSGYCVYAELKIGANGTNEGIPELAAGDAQGDTAFGHTRWDDQVSDGVDSDWVQVHMVAEPGDVTWTVGNAPPVHLTIPSEGFGDFLSLKVRAAVSGSGRQMSWQDLVVSFYQSKDSTRAAETLGISSSSTPIASTMGLSDPQASADRSVTIEPEGSGYQKVDVTAMVRLQSLDQVLPSPQSLFAQVYMYTSPPPVQAVQSVPVYAPVAPAQPMLSPTNTLQSSGFFE